VDGAVDLAGGGRLASGSVELPAGSDAGAFGDLLRDRIGSGVAIVHVSARDEEKGAFVAVVTDDWIGRGVKAGDLVRTASRATGSGGGGKPHLARGGVGDTGRVEDALAAAVRAALDIAEATDGS
jgi:alanyl-tRNA synthetase